MKEIIDQLIYGLKDIASSCPACISMLCGFLLIILESMIPVLPLALFIAINMLLFGNIVGFVLSWIATICGCLLSYGIFKKGFGNRFFRYLQKHPKLEKVSDKFKKIKFSNLVIVMALPFTPAFSINIGAGLAKMPTKKFLFATIISKIFIVYFWGFVGTTLIESLQDIGVIFKLIMILGIAFLLSKIVLKNVSLE